MLYGKSRLNAHNRGYDDRWKRERVKFLLRNPYCWGCAAIGVKRKADTVDHIVPHRGDEHRFWMVLNWQPSCNWHHNSIKPELERMFTAGKIPSAELHLQSATAIQLTRERYKPAVGVDGFAIPGS